ncbi:cardiolipin synthase [Bradyrhizobium pachyrhizi]|uniref:Cardiolipin synthase n=1 Tax=Bradyrhizobium pachyrhizi TaxID=280333 RepID=A0A844SHF5_9BRAD|nr:cardiolipin synthase [Bradyrhizobium pachyrhizi]MVT64955.1 cardiolipin synthase [Bradyrhizobium pachyrhizi]
MGWLLGWLFSDIRTISTWVLFGVHLATMMLAIVRPNRTPAARVAWVAVITFLPLLGVIAYWLFGQTSIGRDRIRNLSSAEARTGRPNDVAYVPTSIDPQAAAQFDLCRSINGLHPVSGNRIVLLGDPDATDENPALNSNAALDALIRDIDKAEHHVHLGFYIWLDDSNGGKVADAVTFAARRGVQCRVLVDALGSRALIGGPRWRQMSKAGVKLVATLNDIPRLGHLAVARVDLRNHRKIAVIDNRIAYCGSQNCADPDFRIKAKYAPWVDILLRCEGPIARQAQYLFLCTWIAETGEGLEGLAAAEPAPESFQSGCVAQMYGTGPTTSGNAMSDSFVGAIYAARKELTITTPYFVPDEAVLRALCAAPRRGVDTTIIFPARNDSWLVERSARSCYKDLLSNGVHVYEYTLGLLHAKSMTIDGKIALVGSANIDRRSMQLNFENNLLIADENVIATICTRQHGYLSVSRPVSIDTVKAWPFHARLVQNAVGMMAPVL